MRATARRKVHTLDVRPLIDRGEEPFYLIMATVAALGKDEALLLVSPFLPAPLIEKLQADGFVIHPERRLDGAWQTQLSRPESE